MALSLPRWTPWTFVAWLGSRLLWVTIPQARRDGDWGLLPRTSKPAAKSPLGTSHPPTLVSAHSRPPGLEGLHLRSRVSGSCLESLPPSPLENACPLFKPAQLPPSTGRRLHCVPTALGGPRPRSHTVGAVQRWACLQDSGLLQGELCLGFQKGPAQCHHVAGAWRRFPEG